MLKRFGEAFREAKQEGKEKGKNVNITFAFRRHEEPGKTPDGMSADFLTEAGVERAKAHGKKLAKDEYLMVAGSKGVERARKTGGHMLSSFRDEAGAAAIVNKEMSAERQEKSGHGEMPPGDVAIYRSDDLDPVSNLKKVFMEAKDKGAETLQAKIQYWLDNPERAVELGAGTPEDTAAEFAHRLNVGVKMSAKLFEGLDMRFENLTHGPKLEAFLQEVLVRDGKRGFKNLDEIGGSSSPGEEISFDITRDDKGELGIKLRFRDNEYDIDMERFGELQELYAEKHR